MNQTKKRLQIINIAISLTDIETIQLQILKLSTLRSDPKLQEIIAGLQAQNYAQTQTLITTYIETPMEEIVQRTPQNDQEIIEEFDLFVTAPETPQKEETELFDFDTLAKEPVKDSIEVNTQTSAEAPKAVQTQQNDTFDDLLNLKAHDVMPGNIELDISHTPRDDFFDIPVEDSRRDKESHIDTNIIPKDDFFDMIDEPVTETSPEMKTDEDFTGLPPKEKEEISEETDRPEEERLLETVSEETGYEVAGAAPTALDKGEAESRLHASETVIKTGYKSIPYIDQKLKNMLTQYPPLHESGERYASVDNWLLKISNEGYTEEEIEEVISHIQKLKENNDIAQAAQLLLISGATESKFAQFMLARELFRGELLEKNLPEAFTLINRLALDDDYPEAICDLAQFYENGVGIGKDKKKAEQLYHEAMERGVKRAVLHYDRVQKANKGLFGKLFGK